jgi:hypothetical protein
MGKHAARSAKPYSSLERLYIYGLFFANTYPGMETHALPKII